MEKVLKKNPTWAPVSLRNINGDGPVVAKELLWLEELSTDIRKDPRPKLNLAVLWSPKWLVQARAWVVSIRVLRSQCEADRERMIGLEVGRDALLFWSCLSRPDPNDVKLISRGVSTMVWLWFWPDKTQPRPSCIGAREVWTRHVPHAQHGLHEPTE